MADRRQLTERLKLYGEVIVWQDRTLGAEIRELRRTIVTMQRLIDTDMSRRETMQSVLNQIGELASNAIGGIDVVSKSNPGWIPNMNQLDQMMSKRLNAILNYLDDNPYDIAVEEERKGGKPMA